MIHYGLIVFNENTTINAHASCHRGCLSRLIFFGKRSLVNHVLKIMFCVQVRTRPIYGGINVYLTRPSHFLFCNVRST